MQLYVLTMEYIEGESELIGVYSTREKAQSVAQEREPDVELKWKTVDKRSPYIVSQEFLLYRYGIGTIELDR